MPRKYGGGGGYYAGDDDYGDDYDYDYDDDGDGGGGGGGGGLRGKGMTEGYRASQRGGSGDGSRRKQQSLSTTTTPVAAAAGRGSSARSGRLPGASNAQSKPGESVAKSAPGRAAEQKQQQQQQQVRGGGGDAGSRGAVAGKPVVKAAAGAMAAAEAGKCKGESRQKSSMASTTTTTVPDSSAIIRSKSAAESVVTQNVGRLRLEDDDGSSSNSSPALSSTTAASGGGVGLGGGGGGVGGGGGQSRRVRPSLPLDSYVPEAGLEGTSTEKDAKELLHLIVIGHVDAGKSTIMGRVLHLLGQVSQKEIHKNEREAKQQGKGSFAYAWVLDEGAEERSRGVTMTVAVAHFETANRRIVLLDAPGHKDFVPNMIAGASQADAAVLVVDATPGSFEAGFDMASAGGMADGGLGAGAGGGGGGGGGGCGGGGGQTREHAQLARSLGVEQLIVAVNKMDVVGYGQQRFDEMKHALGPFLRHCGFKEGAVRWVPVSAIEGKNLKDPPSDGEGDLGKWYEGPTLLEAINGFAPPTRHVSKPLRLPIAEIVRGSRSLGAVAVAGKVEGGGMRVGTRVVVMPSDSLATIKAMERNGKAVHVATAGESVDVGLTGVDPGMLVTGGVICHPDYPVSVVQRFEARVLVLGIKRPILKGAQVVLHAHTAKESAIITQLIGVLDPQTGAVAKHRPRCLTANKSAIVEVSVSRGVCLELYTDYRSLGRVILREGGVTLAVGIVIRLVS